MAAQAFLLPQAGLRSAAPALQHRTPARAAQPLAGARTQGTGLRGLVSAAAAGALFLRLGQGKARVASRVKMMATAAKADPVLLARIQEMVALSPVIIFSKSWCPYCEKAKKAFQEIEVRAAVLELDQLGDDMENSVQDCLEAITGTRTVPRVFIGTKCIGGGDDTAALAASGELQVLAEKATADYKKAVMGDVKFELQKSEAEWEAELDSSSFRVLRKRGTERPGSSEYNKFQPEEGHFACKGCGLPLYSAQSKFPSSCGWPVFNKIYKSEKYGQHVLGQPDGGGSLEIVCKRCGSHLGHVFYDSPSEDNPNGERH